jgi:hypothetical protein
MTTTGCIIRIDSDDYDLLEAIKEALRPRLEERHELFMLSDSASWGGGKRSRYCLRLERMGSYTMTAWMTIFSAEMLLIEGKGEVPGLSSLHVRFEMTY